MPRRERQGPGVISDLTETEAAFLWDRPLPEGTMAERWHAFALQMWTPSTPRYNDEFRNPHDLWTLLGDQVVAAWIEEKPGSRPSNWWRFVAPEIAHEPWMRPGAGALHDHAPDPQTQLVFLMKHGLLTDSERAALAVQTVVRHVT
jgi:hypothetical protein